MPHLNFNGYNIYYEVYGNGKPLLFIHDWNTSGRLFKKFALKYFINDYKIILPDLPGFGKSQMVKDMTPDTIRQIINELFRELGVDRAIISGFCLGAVFALDFTIKEPDKTERTVLIEPIIQFPKIFFIFFNRFFGSIILNFFIRTKPGFAMFNKAALNNNNFYNKILKRAVYNTDTNNSLYYLKMLYPYSLLNHYEYAKNIGADMKIITGQNTFNHIKRCSLKLNKNIRRAETVEIENEGHFLILNASEKVRNCF